MVRHETEAVSTTTTTSAHTKTPRDPNAIADGGGASSPTAADSIDATALPTCRPEHCFHAFDALYCALTHAMPVDPLFPDDKYPLFVTWNARTRRSSSGNNTSSGGHGRGGWSTRLRGCIGSFDPQPLRTGLEEYALLSAFRDHRFRRVELRELPSLECGVSLLTDFESATSYLDWTLGVHGIQISFTPPLTSPSVSDAPSPLSSAVSLLSRPLTHFSSSPSSSSSAFSARRLSATYLPEVAPEQGWEHIDAIDSAIRKAGWNGRISEDLRRSVRVRRYQSRKCVVGWDEFVAWRADRGSPVDVDQDPADDEGGEVEVVRF
ncbi:AMMECR1 domain-containing protein [Russula dissimulans]|nr:AMMECR1 domain-containing protein [Russula dissimulans]